MALNYENPAIITHTAAGAGTVNSNDMNSANFNGMLLFINVSAVGGTPTLTVTISGRTPLGFYYTILASAAITGTGLVVLRVYPGLVAAANLTVNDILPAGFRVSTVIGGGTPSVTATISAVLVA